MENVLGMKVPEWNSRKGTAWIGTGEKPQATCFNPFCLAVMRREGAAFDDGNEISKCI
jgi:hypothetical protein